MIANRSSGLFQEELGHVERAPDRSYSLAALGRRARAAESARLEIVCWATNRGFKSHRLREMGTEFSREAGVLYEAAMNAALEEAKLAIAHNDVPVGAVAVVAGRVVASAHNERELRGDPTAHAEMLVLKSLAERAAGWRMSSVSLIVTLEPCVMCAGAIVAARIERVVFGAQDPKGGACGSVYNVCSDPRLNHEVDVVPGVMEDRCGEILTRFFSEKR